MSANTWRGQWIQDMIPQNRLRHLATPQGLQLRKSPHCNDLATAEHDADSHDGDLLVSTADGRATDEVEKFLIDGATRAEVIEYLGETYGSVFVKDLIKHLHDPGSR